MSDAAWGKAGIPEVPNLPKATEDGWEVVTLSASFEKSALSSIASTLAQVSTVY
jgi:hypothetical protein